MNKRLFTLISAITTAVAGAALALVTYFDPTYAEAINSSIGIFEGAVIGILSNFVKD